MADIDLSVTVSRDSLGLGPLEIASSPSYYLSPKFLGGVVQWDRKQVSSRWLDGDVTVSRRRQSVVEQIGVEVTGGDLAGVQDAINRLVEAFTQDSFTLTVVANGARHVYACEAADYQDASWTQARLAAAQGQVLLQVPRQPVEVG